MITDFSLDTVLIVAVLGWIGYELQAHRKAITRLSRDVCGFMDVYYARHKEERDIRDHPVT